MALAIAGICIFIEAVVIVFVWAMCKAAAPKGVIEQMKADQEQAKYLKEEWEKKHESKDN